jgi:hypothetical protein
MFNIEGHKYCPACNTYVRDEHYSRETEMCYDCIRDEIEEEEAKEAEAEDLW